MFKKLQITSEAVPVGQVFDEFKQSFEDFVSHINVKRIQQKAFQDDLTEPNTGALQIDYALAYQCEYQNEMRSKVPYGLEKVSTCLRVQFFINPLQKLF